MNAKPIGRSHIKVCRRIVRGNTVILDEKLDLPDETTALVDIKPLDKTRDKEIAQKQIELVKNLHKGEKLLICEERDDR